jgi:hypothetical protein
MSIIYGKVLHWDFFNQYQNFNNDDESEVYWQIRGYPPTKLCSPKTPNFVIWFIFTWMQVECERESLYLWLIVVVNHRSTTTTTFIL